MRLLPVLTPIVLVALSAGPSWGQDAPPDGVEQILERGRIAAISEPTFVSASEAGIPDDAWILGVAIDGEAKAYSLNLLNRHEVVNDRFSELPVAAVW